jgi:hypothetical protein
MERIERDSVTNRHLGYALSRGPKLAAALAVVLVVALTLGFAPGALATEGIPVNTEIPLVTGMLAVGDPLSCSEGEWTEKPTEFTYQWLRGGTAIAGEVKSSYTLQTADEGQSLTCEVTAKNAAGSSLPATSAGVTVPTLPANTEAPGLTGMVVIPGLHLEVVLVGDVLSCSNGSWTGSPAPTFTYRWLRDGAAIEGAVENSYKVQTADEGNSLWCEVTATNAAGSKSASSGHAVAPIVRAGGGGGGQFPQGSQSPSEVTPSGGSTNPAGTQSIDTKISYAVTARSGAVYVKLNCSSAAGKCSSVTVQLSIVVVEHLRNGRVTAVTATTKSKAAVKRTVVIGSVTVKLIGGSKTVKVPLNLAGRTLERQHKTLAAQVRLTYAGHLRATEDVQITQATAPAKKSKPATKVKKRA